MESMKSPLIFDQGGKKYLSVTEIAAEYGGSVPFWRKRVLSREVPVTRFGRSVKISRADLEAWLDGRRREAA
jgi:excisionase family DNA binding protein